MTFINTPTTEPDGPPCSRPDWPTALHQHGRWLRTVVASRLGESQVIDEVMQEISLAAIADRAPLIDSSKIAAWLYRLAIIQVLMYRRRSGRQRKLMGRYVERQRSSTTASPIDPLVYLMSIERAELVRQAMGRLPRRDAEILRLKYSENWSYRDLAEHLGQSESAIESRLHRARQRLRAELSKTLSIMDQEP